MVTLDGYFEGPNKELDWHLVDEDFFEFAIEQLNEIDTILFGRITYEMMESYWTTPSAIANDPIIAGKMNNTFKIVFSKTLDKAEWNNTKLIKENISEEISKLKQQPGKDLIIFGSSNLSISLIDHELIDEFRIIISPVYLGKGKSLFTGIHDKLNLKLLKTKVFKSGNVLLYYGR